MLEHKTVFVLGAGASCDYGLLDGQSLLNAVRGECRKIAGGNYEHINNTGFHTGTFEPLRLLLEGTNFRSIDSLLAVHREQAEVGRFMIATCLLPLEKREPFYRENNRDYDWMLYLFELMEKNATLEDFGKNPITFITFNYDRCLEYFLRCHLADRYKASEKDIERVVDQIPIIHVHGQLGTLKEFPFGEVNWRTGASHIKRASAGIKIIHEADPASGDFKLACEALKTAERVGLLGFGYLQENMDRLRFKESLSGKKVFGTYLGMYPPELKSMFGNLSSNPRGSQRPYEPFMKCNCLSLLRQSELLY